MWKCEYYMEVWRINHFGSSLINPQFFLDGLTDRTVSIAAGIIMVSHMSAFCTLTDIYAKPAGFTVKYGTGSF